MEAPRVLDLAAEARALMPAVEVYDPALRGAAQRTWLGRMRNEHGSAPVFEGLAAQLREAGEGEAMAQACLAMAAEERTHGVLCAAVVLAFGGEPAVEAPPVVPLPRHEEVSRREAALRNVLSVCCLSETVAVALIGAERLEMPEGELRALLTRIFADEVGHARFGWLWLAEVAPSLDAAARARLGCYLEVAFAHLEHHELAHLPASTSFPPAAAALGLCNGAEARELFVETVETVIIPRLEEHGLPARAAWENRRLAA